MPRKLNGKNTDENNLPALVVAVYINMSLFLPVESLEQEVKYYIVVFRIHLQCHTVLFTFFCFLVTLSYEPVIFIPPHGI